MKKYHQLTNEISSIEELKKFIDESEAFEILIIEPGKFKNSDDYFDEILELARKKNIIIGF